MILDSSQGKSRIAICSSGRRLCPLCCLQAYGRGRPVSNHSAILIFEDDANLRPEFEASILGMLPELPPDWDILDLDPAPRLCGNGSWWNMHPKSRVPNSQYQLYRSHVAFTRTTAVVYSAQGARTILAHLPTSLVVDLHVARLLRLGILAVYVSCDGLVVQSKLGLEQVRI